MYFHLFLGLKYEESCMQVNGDNKQRLWGKNSFRILFHIYQIYQTRILLSAHYFHLRQSHRQRGNSKHLLVYTLFLIFRKRTKSLRRTTKEGLKAYESLEPYNQFASGWVKKLKIKLFLNHLLKLPWLLDGSVR